VVVRLGAGQWYRMINHSARVVPELGPPVVLFFLALLVYISCRFGFLVAPFTGLGHLAAVVTDVFGQPGTDISWLLTTNFSVGASLSWCDETMGS
jgi:hypothetical protein